MKDENGNNTKVRNPDFPQNYINHIKENLPKYKYILVSSHAEVRKALCDNDMYFTLIYPHKSLKKEFIKRMQNRGNTESFIELADKSWDIWIESCEESDPESLEVFKFIYLFI